MFVDKFSRIFWHICRGAWETDRCKKQG
jgi:hypothetical protein